MKNYRIDGTLRIGLLLLLAIVCFPCNKAVFELALVFAYPTQFYIFLFSAYGLAFVATGMLGAWVGLSILLKIWID